MDEGLTYSEHMAIFLILQSTSLGWTKHQTASTPLVTGTHSSVMENLSSEKMIAHPPPGCLFILIFGLL